MATAGSSSSPRTGARTGARGCERDREPGSRRWPTSIPRSRFVVPMHPNPAVREQLREPRRRARERPAHRAAAVSPEFARLLGRCAPGHHRLRRDPGGGAVARQARAGGPRGDRAGRGRRGRHAAAGRHRRRADRRRGRPSAHRRRAPTRGWPRRTNPYGDGRAAERIVERVRAHRARGSEPPAPFGPGYTPPGGDQGGAAATSRWDPMRPPTWRESPSTTRTSPLGTMFAA